MEGLLTTVAIAQTQTALSRTSVWFTVTWWCNMAIPVDEDRLP